MNPILSRMKSMLSHYHADASPRSSCRCTCDPHHQSPVLALIDSVALEPGGESTLSLTVVQAYDDLPSPCCLALPITLTLRQGPAIGVNVSSATVCQGAGGET